MPATTHYDRELLTLNDLEVSFPDFTGKDLSWVHNPGDPPDFIAQSPAGAVSGWSSGSGWTDGR